MDHRAKIHQKVPKIIFFACGGHLQPQILAFFGKGEVYMFNVSAV